MGESLPVDLSDLARGSGLVELASLLAIKRIENGVSNGSRR
jgi:hypothetical protein